MNIDEVLVIDTETTGLNEDDNDRVVEVCLRLGLDIDSADVQVWRINPGIPIEVDAHAAHGITDEMVASCPTFGEVAEEMLSFMRLRRLVAVAGYNPDFDVKILTQEFKRCGIDVRWPRSIICAQRLWRIHDPPPPRHLTAAFERFVGIRGEGRAHNAMTDVSDVAQVLLGQLAEFKLFDKSWNELDPERELWWGPSYHIVWADATKTQLLCNFGKHQGVDVNDLNHGYLKYIVDKDFPHHVKVLVNFMRRRLKPTPDEVLCWAKAAEVG